MRRGQAAYNLPLGDPKPKVKADEVFEADDAEVERLIREGLARVPDDETGATDMAAPKKGEGGPQYKVVGAQPATVTTPRNAKGDV